MRSLHDSPPRLAGPYLLFGEIAAGELGTVHLGRLNANAGAHTVAIKRLHPHLARDAELVAMFLHEIRIAARIRHPNVVATLEPVNVDREIFVAMEYVHGESLGKLFRASVSKRTPLDPRIITSVMSGVLHGLHAAHEARDERGQPLDVVHRDVSPHNILVGVDGRSRVLDFGLAQAIRRLHSTGSSTVTNKLPYTAPEQLSGGTVTRQADVYAASVVIWEALTGYRLFRGEHHAAIIAAVLQQPVSPPSRLAPDVPPELDRIVMRGLQRSPALRYGTALEMARELEQYTLSAPNTEVGAWVQLLASEELARRAALITEIESASQTVPQRVPLTSPTDRTGDAKGGGSSPPLALHSELRPRLASPSLRRTLIGLAGAVFTALVFAIVLLLVQSGRASNSTPALHKAFHAPAVEVTAPSSEVTTPSGQDDTAAEEPAPALGIDEHATEELPTPEPETPTPAAQEGVARELGTTNASRPARARTTVGRKPKADDCRIPYRIDEKGHKRYKPACL
ncbi:MAG TPA: serine/threonine-protein kinase [Polyangiaceae bacterium]